MTFEEAAHICVATVYGDDVLVAGIVSAWLDDTRCWYAS